MVDTTEAEAFYRHSADVVREIDSDAAKSMDRLADLYHELGEI